MGQEANDYRFEKKDKIEPPNSPTSNFLTTTTPMLKNYFKIAWRNLTRNKLRSLIHILGLSLGISISFLIYNVIVHAYSFDLFHPDRERIFRINTLTDWGDGGSFPNSGTPGPLGEVIEEELSGIEQKSRIYTLYEVLSFLPEKNRVMGRISDVTFADAGFFKIFPRTWLVGNPEKALETPQSVVITESRLKKYFPDLSPADVIGKEIAWVDQDTIRAQITGVVADFDQPTDLIFNEFISYSTLDTDEEKEWYGLHDWGSVNSSSNLFVKVAEQTDKNVLDLGLEAIAKKHYELDEDATTSFFAEPLSEIHFSSNYTETAVSKEFLSGLTWVGLVILVLACMNFVNLETAQAIGRAKEVGIRKTLGSRRKELVFQFLTETFLLVLVASVVSLGLVELIRLIFSPYLPLDLQINYFAGANLLFFVFFPVVLTLLTGIYPALVLSGYQPQRALKGESGISQGFSWGVFLRKNLTVLQFSTSIAFIILVLVLHSQIRYVSSQPLGFEKESLLYSQLPFMSDPAKMSLLQERLLQQENVLGSSLSGSLVSSESLWTSDAYVPVDTSERQIFIQVMNVDSAFIGVNRIKHLAGKAGLTSADEILVNSNFIKEMGLQDPQEALGLEIRFNGNQKKIVGVIGNFHSRTLREEIRPMVLTTNPTFFQTITVRISPGQNLAQAKSDLESVYKEIYPYETADFSFLDEEVERLYAQDIKIRNVLAAACFLAILISAMGLFGLSSYTIAQRTKEISIRKVLGASLVQLLGMISKEYVVLVLVSFALAIYPAYFFIRSWLQEFTYKIDMPFGLFGLAGLGVLTLCLAIVGLHSYDAAQTNPAQVLKDE